ncbi:MULTISPECIES: hypothetical protein [Stenotrophomonas]|uniref:hypothetical protein n=1 Tax=Stenotrophomonas TaxID=40323 RepID=UPI000D53D4AF|nr:MULTISPECIES: hypothetical protein [Stenotrophomonas]AWH21870.1 hypothetical protein C1933_11955 [Stenotrophomonas sp. ZAC14D2_NAIMI4_6]
MKKLFHAIGWFSTAVALAGFVVLTISEDPEQYRQPFTDFCFGYSLAFIGAACITTMTSYVYGLTGAELKEQLKRNRPVLECIVIAIGAAVFISYGAMGLIGPLFFKNPSKSVAIGLVLGNILWAETASRLAIDWLRKRAPDTGAVVQPIARIADKNLRVEQRRKKLPK